MSASARPKCAPWPYGTLCGASSSEKAHDRTESTADLGMCTTAAPRTAGAGEGSANFRARNELRVAWQTLTGRQGRNVGRDEDSKAGCGVIHELQAGIDAEAVLEAPPQEDRHPVRIHASVERVGYGAADLCAVRHPRIFFLPATRNTSDRQAGKGAIDAKKVVALKQKTRLHAVA